MESKGPAWWASSRKGVPSSLMQSQRGGDRDCALLGKLSKKPSVVLQSHPRYNQPCADRDVLGVG